MAHPRTAFVVIFLLGAALASGCGKSDDAAASGATDPDAGAPVCDGTVTRLGDLDLGAGFFGDDYTLLGTRAQGPRQALNGRSPPRA